MTPTREAMRAERRASGAAAPRSHPTPADLGTIPGHAAILAGLLRFDPTDHEYLHRRSLAEDPVRALCAAVLTEAVTELEQLRGWLANGRGTEPRVRVRYAQLRAWFMAPDRDWPFSFLNLCDALNIAVQPVRAWLEARMPEHSIADIVLPQGYGTPAADWRNVRAPIADRVWSWAWAQPGPWRVVDMRAALGITHQQAYSRLKWPVQTGRMRRVGPGVFEVVRAAEKGVG